MSIIWWVSWCLTLAGLGTSFLASTWLAQSSVDPLRTVDETGIRTQRSEYTYQRALSAIRQYDKGARWLRYGFLLQLIGLIVMALDP